MSRKKSPRRLDQAALEELLEDRPAGALDVHPAPADEVAVLLADPCRARQVRAVVAHGALVADDGVPQTGQVAGISNSRSAPVRRSRIGRTTSGITSPAFWRTTWSPIRMSLRRTSSRLWSVARATVEPATLIGRRWATGVSVPVRPT